MAGVTVSFQHRLYVANIVHVLCKHGGREYDQCKTELHLNCESNNATAAMERAFRLGGFTVNLIDYVTIALKSI